MIVIEALLVVGVICVIGLAIYAGYNLGKTFKKD
jgi:hypothetical protein